MRVAAETIRGADRTLIETTFGYDPSGRLTWEVATTGGAQAVTTVFRYDRNSRLVLKYMLDPQQTLLSVRMFTYGNEGMPETATFYSDIGAMVRTWHYSWQSDHRAVATVTTFPSGKTETFGIVAKDGRLHNLELLTPVPGDATVQLLEVRNRFDGDSLTETELKYGQMEEGGVTNRLLKYDRSPDGLLIGIDMTDSPSGRRARIELRWEEGYSIGRHEDRFAGSVWGSPLV